MAEYVEKRLRTYIQCSGPVSPWDILLYLRPIIQEQTFKVSSFDGCAFALLLFRSAQMGGVRRHPRLRQQLRHRRVAPVAAPHERPHSVGRSAGTIPKITTRMHVVKYLHVLSFFVSSSSCFHPPPFWPSADKLKPRFCSQPPSAISVLHVRTHIHTKTAAGDEADRNRRRTAHAAQRLPRARASGRREPIHVAAAGRRSGQHLAEAGGTCAVSLFIWL